ncbi:MAG: hypothetical protein KatS3mg110_1222 [Pirellulaceae bacterium]|nr:MAG: hypothetical protein KatS3mg110_1222 [Pirellulaceae bacterium]
MTENIFEQRRKALEEAFFAKRNQELLDALRAQLTNEQLKKRLSEISGIQDPQVLEHLVQAGVRPETLMALSLVPLVMVAWADDIVQDGERRIILKAAEQEGLKPQDEAYRLLQAWLDEKPEDRLLQDWRAYVAALRQRVSPETLQALRSRIIGQAKRIARAAGGFYGFLSTTEAEERLIQQLEKAFE